MLLFKLEDQLSRLSSVKRSKKETETAWDKERKELSEHVANLEAFIKELQTQLLARTGASGTSSPLGITGSAAAQLDAYDQFGQNERIQSLSGENDFLKNRIREVRKTQTTCLKFHT